ncbi:MAG TPA: fibronectin type III domain-containing protein [Candidatus Nanopelagicaceae bacterium]
MLNGIILKTVAGFFAVATAGLGSPVPTAIAGDSQVKISWAPPTQPIFGVEVEESLDSGNSWIIARILPPTSTRVSVQNLTNGKNYWFRVRWIWLDSSLGIPSSPPLVAIPINNPNAPTGLVATPSADQVGLSWDKDPNKSIVGYQIDQSTDGGNTWRTIKANTGSSSNGFLVNNLIAGKTYNYRIRAIGFAGVQSEYSASAEAILATAPTGGYALKYAIKNSKVILTWDTPTDLSDVQSYDVNVSGDGGVNWYKVATLQGGINTAVVPYVIGGSAYQIIATSSSSQTSSSQVQLVQSNLIPDSLQTPNSAPTPNSGAASPTPSPSPLSAHSSSNSTSPSILIGAAAVFLLLIGGGTWAIISSNKKKNSKSRYKNRPRKPYKKKAAKKKKNRP